MIYHGFLMSMACSVGAGTHLDGTKHLGEEASPPSIALLGEFRYREQLSGEKERCSSFSFNRRSS